MNCKDGIEMQMKLEVESQMIRISLKRECVLLLIILSIICFFNNVLELQLSSSRIIVLKTEGKALIDQIKEHKPNNGTKNPQIRRAFRESYMPN